MAAYKQLKGIAAGLAGTFISRNNDVDGYWGMGVIYSEVSARGVSAVTFSLLDGAVSPSLKCGSLVTQTYREKAETRLRAVGLTSEEVTSIQIHVCFEQHDHTQKCRIPITWGAPFTCRVTITDLHETERSITIQGCCGKHDPKRERRSVRRSPYPYFTNLPNQSGDGQ